MLHHSAARPLLSLLAIAFLVSGCSSLHSLSPGDFKSRDLNGDGKISKQEFTAFALQRFQNADTNGDGKLTLDELTANFIARFDVADTNHNGVVTLEEHVAYWVSPEMTAGMNPDAAAKARLQQGNLHGQIDANANGSASFIENRDYSISRFNAMSQDGKTLTKQDIEVTVHTLFTAMDTNKDGIVSLDEFTTYHISQP